MVYLDTMPLRFGHFRVLITTAMGQFLGAAVATLSGVLIPLLAIVQHHELDSVTQGLIASMELIGIMVGSFVIGKLADKDGYLPFLRLSSILVFIGALVVYVSGSIDLLIPSLFVMGFGIGGDFALDSDYVDEVMPKRWQETLAGNDGRYYQIIFCSRKLVSCRRFPLSLFDRVDRRNLETDLLICGLSLIFNDHQPFILF